VGGRDLGTTALQIVTSTCIAVPPQHGQRGKRLTNGNPIVKAVEWAVVTLMENVPKSSSKVPASFMSAQPIPEHGISNRRPSMARKLERARVQGREAAAIEFTKLYYLMQPSKRELRARVFSFDGVIRRFSSKPLRQRRTRWSGEPRSNFDCTGRKKGALAASCFCCSNIPQPEQRPLPGTHPRYLAASLATSLRVAASVVSISPR
jgi:hypothetical protein